MRVLIFLLCLLLCASSAAQSARFGPRMVSVGDTAERVREVAGAPDDIESEATETGPREQWTYRRRGRLIQLWLADGQVVYITDRKDSAE